MSKIEVDTIDKQSGSTLTVGGSGTTVQLGTGASQTGFGRTGTVDWQTSIKTATFTAASGEGYFCNTSAGGFTVNLPSSPSVGDIVAVKDYAGTFDNQNLTLDRNGSNIEGQAANKVLTTESLSITFIYADATKGWLAVNDMAESQLPKFIAATGGTVTTVCTDFKVHTFTGPGTFDVTCAGNSVGSNEVSYMVVAGGGGGGGTSPGGGPYSSGGGGGAGGFREGKSPQTPYTASPLDAGSGLTVPVQGYPIVVGGGGSAGPTSSSGGQGNNSSFSTITSTGGGFGTGRGSPTAAGPGGSGGGGSGLGSPITNSNGGTGNTPSVSPAQGKNGGNGSLGPYSATGANGGGGGGATVAGVSAPALGGGDGGAGATTSINNTPTTYGGGGGGGVYYCAPDPAYGPAGSGDGGAGGGGPGGSGPASIAPDSGRNATDNTGGGGGGGSTINTNSTARGGGSGGSGIVIIRYKFQ